MVADLRTIGLVIVRRRTKASRHLRVAAGSRIRYRSQQRLKPREYLRVSLKVKFPQNHPDWHLLREEQEEG